MSGFGGAVKLTGESEYRRALQQINQSLKETASEMKAVSSAYASNDKSQSAVSAKTEVLNKKLQEQTQKLNTLKAQYSQMSASYSQQTSKHTALVNEYNKEKSKLDEIGRTLGTTSKEYQDQKAKVDGLAQEVRKSTQAQDANEKSMSRMRTQINNAQADVNNTARELDNLAKEEKEAGDEAGKASHEFTSWKMILAELGASAIKSALNGLRKLAGAFVSVGKQSLESYAQYEQLVGGVETLFGKSSTTVQKYADNAYKTAGLSANEYMETVTSFSASLLQGLGGDTEKTAKYADKAITDMSDNANKMGTSMESIQNAYQGFAKGNYTMLDNLKLGYGGTKSEMLRLVKDAGVVNDSVKSIDDVSFDQIIEAIHITQDRIGITGTTAKEASTTIEGSVSSMKSAWQNLLTGMADDNANFEGLVDNFVESLMTMLDNILPRIQTIISGMANTAGQLLEKVVPQLVQMIPPLLQQTLPLLLDAVHSLIQSVLDILPEVMPMIAQMIPQIVTTLLSMLPQIIDAGIQILLGLIQGLNQAIPQLLEILPTVITQIVDVLLQNLPLIIQTGLQLLVSLITGLANAIPQLIAYVPKIVTTITRVLLQNLPLIISSAIKIMLALIKGLVQSLPQLIAMIPRIIISIVQTLARMLPQIVSSGVKIITSLVKGIGQNIKNVGAKAKEVGQAFLEKVKEFPSKMLNVGLDLVKGIWNGISNGTGWIKSQISSWVGNVTSFLKKLFKIGSPSKLFADEIGKNLALGIGTGFTHEMKAVEAEMGDAIPKSFNIDTSVNGMNASNGMTYSADVVGAFKEALSQVKIVLDDEVAGEFVDRTVTRIIYT